MKTIQQFIEENREELTEYIDTGHPDYEIDDDEIEMWIMNDEWLYNWATNGGVEV
jgi:hypothetical protein